DHFHVLAAEPARSAAAVHGGVAAAEHDDALADLRGMAEGHRGEPVDADVDVGGRFPAARDVEIASARRAAADEHGIVPVGQQPFHAVDARAAPELDPEVEDVTDLLVDHLEREAEAGNLRPDHAAGARILVEHGYLIAERRQVARHRERSRSRADAGDALAVAPLRRLRQARADVVLVVGRDPLQAADRHRLGRLGVLFLDAPAPARGLARAIAGAPENAGEDVRFPVDQIGVAVTPGGDQPDVFRDGSVGRTSPLTIYDLMEVVGIAYIGG